MPVRTLYIAAGGGGDALGVLLVHPLLDKENGVPLIATYAWERLRVDPVPGPRGISGFANLGTVASHPIEVLASSDTVPPGRSTLPRLAADTRARLFILDPWDGALGMSRQLDLLVRHLDVDHVVALDVGGDAVAKGDETDLLSPLADSLAIAACRHLTVPVQVVVAGPGVDGELNEHTVFENLEALCAVSCGCVGPREVALIRSVLTWHPSEATAVLATAALGIRGTVEIRRRSITVTLTDRSPTLWTTSFEALAKHSLLVEPLAETRSLAEAESVVRRTTVSELDRERERAKRLDWNHIDTIPVDLAHRINLYTQDAIKRGVDLITSRRLVEAIDLPNLETGLLTEALGSRAATAMRGALWDVRTLNATCD